MPRNSSPKNKNLKILKNRRAPKRNRKKNRKRNRKSKLKNKNLPKKLNLLKRPNKQKKREKLNKQSRLRKRRPHFKKVQSFKPSKLSVNNRKRKLSSRHKWEYFLLNLGDGLGHEEEEAGRDVQKVPVTDWYSDGLPSSIRLNIGQEDIRNQSFLVHSHASTPNR